ncbi:MAG: DUF1249 domain-containing protein [Litorivicinus sp.]
MSFIPNRRNRRYVPNLAAQQAESASNYVLLARLMLLLDDQGEAIFGVPGQGHILLTLTERSPYTSFVTLVGLDRATWLQVPQLDVRMYHDARMAEIASIDGYRPVRGSHSRDDRRRHADEKQQINTYLGEWLRHCLNTGLAAGRDAR